MHEYRLGELSERSGVSVRNIRAYRERGLLDPPRREGRSAYYDDRHLAQLTTINELLRKGYTPDSIVNRTWSDSSLPRSRVNARRNWTGSQTAPREEYKTRRKPPEHAVYKCG